jgi:Flp pilus assembly protein TadD
MNLFHTIRRWLKTRDYRRLWWCIPVMLALSAWVAFAFCLADWKPAETRSRYDAIVQRALGARDFETARVASQRLLSMGAEPRSKWLFHLALSMAGLGRDREASAIFSTIAPLDHAGYLPAHLFIAQALMARTNLTRRDIQTAEQHLNHVISHDPSSLDANQLLAQTYIQTAQWELASERLREVVSVRPETSLLLAAVLKQRGDQLGARSWAERAAKFHREKVEAAKVDLPTSRLAWAEATMMLEDYAGAFSILEAGYKLSGDKLYMRPLGEICAAWVSWVMQNKPDDVESRVSLVQQGLQYDPENEILIRQLVQLSQLRTAEAGPARETLDRMLAQGQSAAILHFALGVDCWGRGQSEMARNHFALSYEAAPQMPDIANNMAMILAVGDPPDLPRALAIIQSVLEKLPNNPNFRQTRGIILVKLGRWQEAVPDLEYALPLLASKRSTHEALAQAYTGLGLTELASRHQQLAQNPASEKTPPRSRAQ